ncbi:UNVERIFIED_CONTAM: hypothetical protein GTU68_064400 [Idotea baltica]|nr:hypothetical protein [Idotea baltica]
MSTAQTDYITLFGREFANIGGEKRLSSIFSRNAGLRDQINFETSDAEVLSILRTSANETVDLTFKRLKDRIDKLGVVQPNVSLDAARDLILVELPGIDNPERARSFLQSAAKLDKKRGSDAAPLTGEHVVKATSQPDPMNQQVLVSLSMDNQGARIWGDMTTKAAQDNNREIAIMLDDEVVSAPRVNDAITNGNSQISGDFSIQEGKDLANILQIGKLPASTNIIQEAVVGPSLGADNISRSLMSLIVGFCLVIVFMLFYYGGAGIVSIIALLANLFFIFGALASYGTVLTLPGFAGIILTIGMAVDANVIIYERIKEELREGKSHLMAISDGFKNSYSAIIDANVTTILTAFILAYFGIGPIKGFAVVLIIGVIFSMFTAVLFARLIIDTWTSRGNGISFWTSASKNLFANLNIDWLGKRKIAYVVSGAIILAGIVSFATRSFDLGVDFKGGHAYTVQIDQSTPVDATTLRSALASAFGSEPVVKSVDTDNTYNVVTEYLIDSEEDGADEQVMQKLYEGINDVAGGSLSFDSFKDAEGEGTHVISSSKVGPTIADDIKESSIYAAVFALLCIFLYIFIRFSKWQYSAGAVAALFHDSLIVLSIFSIFHGLVPWTMEIDQNFIAALLTVIGYSINDTVIIFDRIREYLGTYSNRNKTETINMAINSTFSRTIITSFTTLMVVLILFLFGGASIKGFAFALVVGIISGTYSTVFIASPLLHDLTGDMEVKQVSKKKHFSKAVV